MSCDRYIDQHARTALQCSPDDEHMCSGHWTLPHTRESHLVKAFHNSDMCCRVSHTFFPHNSTHSELRGCVDTTARFCTHATRMLHAARRRTTCIHCSASHCIGRVCWAQQAALVVSGEHRAGPPRRQGTDRACMGVPPDDSRCRQLYYVTGTAYCTELL